jgi:mono/diheme cytochrome c family protein
MMLNWSRQGLLAFLCLTLITCLGAFFSPVAAGAQPGPGGGDGDPGPLCQMGGMRGGMMGGQGYCGPGGGPVGPVPGISEQSSGAELFSANCAACHPGGGNTLTPSLPLRGSAQLRDYETFRVFVRYPTMPDGSRGAMPAFPSSRLSNGQMLKLYRYLISRWGE